SIENAQQPGDMTIIAKKIHNYSPFIPIKFQKSLYLEICDVFNMTKNHQFLIFCIEFMKLRPLNDILQCEEALKKLCHYMYKEQIEVPLESPLSESYIRLQSYTKQLKDQIQDKYHLSLWKEISSIIVEHYETEGYKKLYSVLALTYDWYL